MRGDVLHGGRMFETEEAKEVYVTLKTVGSLIGSEVMRKLCLSKNTVKIKMAEKS